MLHKNSNFENLLAEAIDRKNDYIFAHILNDLKVNPDQEHASFENRSIFEKVLSIPKSKVFIGLCLANGSDFFKPNSKRLHPLKYAVESFCTDNLDVLIRSGRRMIDSLSYDFVRLKFLNIMNAKLENGSNYLHFLVGILSQENFEEVSKVIQLLIENGCCPSTLNASDETPYNMLMRKVVRLDITSELCTPLIEKFVSKMEKEEIEDAEGNQLGHLEQNPEVDYNFLLKLIRSWNEKKFEELFEHFASKAGNTRGNYALLLEEAVVRNLPRAAAILVSYGADVNARYKHSCLNMTPAFIAVTMAHHNILKIFLDYSFVNFRDDKKSSNLLQRLLATEHINATDRKTCFDLLINDMRCDVSVINETDGEGQSPLFLACQIGDSGIIKELLRRGAYIGQDFVIESLDKNIFEQFLEENMIIVEGSTGGSEVFMDFKFLKPPKNSKSEMYALTALAQNPRLKHTICHPVNSTFLQVKWLKVDAIVYFNLLLYFAFMLFLGIFIVNYYNVSNYTVDAEYCRNLKAAHIWVYNRTVVFSEHGCSDLSEDETFTTADCGVYPDGDDICSDEDYNEDWSKKDIFLHLKKTFSWLNRINQHLSANANSFYICIFGLSILSIIEFIQFVMTWKKYFFAISNILDIFLICLSFFVLVENIEVGNDEFKVICSLMILLMAWQSLQLISRISAFSLSLHMAVLDRVTRTFMKTIAPYLIIILAFGMSFYALNFDLGPELFSDINELFDEDSFGSNITEWDTTGADNKSQENRRDSLYTKVVEIDAKLERFGELLSSFYNTFEDFLRKGEEDEKLTKGFKNPYISVISTVRMMVGDYEAAEITNNDIIKGILVLLFMIFISIILFNLLNALAISDTQEILKTAEFVDLKNIISTLQTYERIFDFFRLKYLNLFPKVLKVSLNPHKFQVIKKFTTFIPNKTGLVKIEIGSDDEINQKWEPILYESWMFWKGLSQPLRLGDRFIKNLDDDIESRRKRE